jgi:nitroreductase
MKRKPEYPINSLFINRWSPRAFTGELISQQELMTLLEAARWAPSSYNNQPWRFLYAHKDGPYWNLFFNLLVEANKIWVYKAAVLILIISRNNFTYNNLPSRTHSFDAGAAWENLALQAVLSGLATHALEGFDYDAARELLSIPDNYTVEAMVAIGRQAPASVLPLELQEREQPNERKPLPVLCIEGPFTQALEQNTETEKARA